jgi:hypothetical protein
MVVINPVHTGDVLHRLHPRPEGEACVRLAAETLLAVLALVQQVAGLSSWQSSLLTVGYLVAIVSTKPTRYCEVGTEMSLALER